MAGVIKVNPPVVETNWEVVGKDIGFFTIDFDVDVSGSLGPRGAVNAVYKTVLQTTTIIAAGPLHGDDKKLTFATEPALLPAQITELQTAVQALDTVDGVDLSASTVTASELII